MRFRFDDNAQEAFQFLVLGAGGLLVIRLLYQWVEGSLLSPAETTPMEEAIAAFRDGYLLRERNVLVTGGSGIGGRLALAFLGAIVAASLAAALAATLAKARSAQPLRAAVVTARSVLLVSTLWGLHASLFLPPRLAVIDKEAIILVERPAVLHTLSLPWPADEQVIPQADVLSLSTRTFPTSFHGCGQEEVVEMMTNTGPLVLARSVPTGRNCNEAIARATMNGNWLAEQLRTHMGLPSGSP